MIEPPGRGFPPIDQPEQPAEPKRTKKKKRADVIKEGDVGKRARKAVLKEEAREPRTRSEKKRKLSKVKGQNKAAEKAHMAVVKKPRKKKVAKVIKEEDAGKRARKAILKKAVSEPRTRSETKRKVSKPSGKTGSAEKTHNVAIIRNRRKRKEVEVEERPQSIKKRQLDDKRLLSNFVKLIEESKSCEAEGNLDQAKLKQQSAYEEIQKIRDVNVVDANGNTLLHFAFSLNLQPLAIDLLKKGAKLNENNEGELPLVLECKENGNSILHSLLITPPIDADDEQLRVQICEHILEKFPGLIYSENSDGMIPIMFACKNGDVGSVKLLAKPDQVDYIDLFKKTAVHYAIESKNIEIIESVLRVAKFLMEDIERDQPIDSDGNTILHYACKTSNDDLVRHYRLIARELFFKSNNLGVNPFSIALSSENKNVELITNVLFAIKLLFNKSGDEWKSTIIKEIEGLNQEAKDFLLMCAINARSWINDEEGIAVLREILKVGADCNKSCEDLGENNLPKDATIFMLSLANYPNSTIPRLLLEYGVDINKSAGGLNALHFTCLGGSVDLFEEFVSKGLDITAKGTEEGFEGINTLMCAARSSNKELFDHILSRHPDPNIAISERSSEGWTALDYAINTNDASVVNILLDKNAPFSNNLQNLNFFLSNHTNCTDEIKAHYIDAIHKIIREEPGILNEQDKYGETPLMVAVRAGKSEIFSEILDLYLSKMPETTSILQQSFDFALRYYKSELFLELLKKGCPFSSIPLNINNLMVSKTYHKGEEDEKLLITNVVLELIKKEPELLTQRDAKGKTPLIAAMDCNDNQIFGEILDICLRKTPETTLILQEAFEYALNNIKAYFFVEFVKKKYALSHTIQNLNNIIACNSSIDEEEKGDGKQILNEIMHSLIKESPELLTQNDNTGKTPLMVAIELNDKEIFRDILDVYLSKIPDTSAALQSAFDFALNGGKAVMSLEFIKKKCLFSHTIQNLNNIIKLASSAYEEYSPIFANLAFELINENPELLTQLDSSGKTAVVVAMDCSNKEVFNKILDIYISKMPETEVTLRNAFDYALLKYKSEFFLELLKKGCHFSSISLNLHNLMIFKTHLKEEDEKLVITNVVLELIKKDPEILLQRDMYGRISLVMAIICYDNKFFGEMLDICLSKIPESSQALQEAFEYAIENDKKNFIIEFLRRNYHFSHTIENINSIIELHNKLLGEDRSFVFNLIRELLEKDPGLLTQQDKYKRSPIMTAIVTGNSEMFTAFIDIYQKPGITEEKTAELHRIFDYTLENTNNPKIVLELLKIKCPFSHNVENLAWLIDYANRIEVEIREPLINVIRDLIEKEPGLLTQKDKHQRTPSRLIINSNPDIFKAIIDQYIEDGMSEAKTSELNKLLNFAIYENAMDNVCYLLRKGFSFSHTVDNLNNIINYVKSDISKDDRDTLIEAVCKVVGNRPEILTEEDFDSNTPLLFAASSSRDMFVALIDIYLKPEITEEKRAELQTLLYRALKNRVTHNICELLKRGCKLPQTIHDLGCFIECNLKRSEEDKATILNAISEIIRKNPEILNLKDANGASPLNIAANIKNEAAFKTLVEIIGEIEPRLLNTYDYTGNTPLMTAIARFGDIDLSIIDALIMNGSDPSFKNSSGHSALSKLFSYDFKKPHTYAILDILCKSPKADNLLNSRVVNYWYPNGTILFKIARAGEIDRFKEYVEKGANPIIHDINGASPISILVETNNPTLLADLKTMDIDFENTGSNRDGYTLLHTACRNGNLELAEFLIEKGMTLSEKNRYGETPLQCLLFNFFYKTPNFGEKKSKLTDKLIEDLKQAKEELTKAEERLGTALISNNPDFQLIEEEVEKLKNKVDVLESRIEDILYIPDLTNVFDGNSIEKLLKKIFEIGDDVEFHLKDAIDTTFNEETLDKLLTLSNPLEFALCLNDKKISRAIAKKLGAEKFDECMEGIKRKYPHQIRVFEETLKYDLDKRHFDVKIEKIPPMDREERDPLVGELITIFNEVMPADNLDKQNEFRTYLIGVDKTIDRKLLERRLTSFLENYRNNIFLTGFPENEDERKEFFKELMTAAAHTIKAVSEKASYEDKAIFMREYLNMIANCGPRLLAEFNRVYFETVTPKSQDVGADLALKLFEDKVYGVITQQREEVLRTMTPMDSQSIHYIQLMRKRIADCNIPVPRMVDPYAKSRDEMKILDIRSSFLKLYQCVLMDTTREFLKLKDVHDSFVIWCEQMEDVPDQPILPNNFTTAFEQHVRGEEVANENLPIHLFKDLRKIAQSSMLDEDDLQHKECRSNVLASYFKPGQWMQTDFQMIIKDGDAALEDPDFDPILKQIIEECGLKDKLNDVFKDKSFDKVVEAVHMRKLQQILIDKFIEKYAPNFSDNKIAYVLEKLGILRPVDTFNSPIDLTWSVDEIDQRVLSLPQEPEPIS